MAYPAPWRPSLDSEHTKDFFFSKEPREALENGDFANVPVMIGHNKDEGLIFTANLNQSPDKVKFLM